MSKEITKNQTKRLRATINYFGNITSVNYIDSKKKSSVLLL